MLSSWAMLLACLVSLKAFSMAQNSTLDEAWRDWKTYNGRGYTEEEEAFRRAIWEKNWQMVERHNREADEGKHTYWMEMNQFSDWTNEEFDRMGGPFPESAVPQTRDVQLTPKPKRCHQGQHGTSRKDQLALAYRRKLAKHRSDKFGKLCLISSNGTKKLLGRRCGCISRYRRRCQKCCKLAL